MKRLQNNHLTMHLATSTVLTENAVKFASFTAYPGLKALIDQSILDEQALANSQESRKRNSTSAKNHVKNAVVDFVLDLSSKLSAYAIVTGNRALLDKVRYKANSIKRSSDNKLVMIFESILVCAADNSAVVLEYGVTVQLLEDGAALLENFKVEMQNMLLSNSEQKQLTAQLRQQFKTTDASLGKVDAMVKAMRANDPVMYRLYHNARRKRRNGGAKLAARCKVFDAGTRQPLAKVRISIHNSDRSKAVAGADLMKNVKFSGNQGGFHLKSLPTGTYLFSATYSGYAEQEVTVYINEGILSKVEIPLTRLVVNESAN